MTDTKSSRADLAHQALRQAIIEQALVPGARLPEDEIGRHFGMSRTLARAVLARLQGEGLVETTHRKTARVACPSLEEARAVFGVRRALEREVVRLVAARWTTETGAVLDAHLQEEEQARRGGHERLSIRLAGEFHQRLASMAGNPLLERYVTETVCRCSLTLSLHGRPHSPECGIQEHRAIVEALRAGDAPQAEALMERHVGAVEERALLHDEGREPDLGAILARYAAAGVAQAAAAPLAVSRDARRAVQ